MTRAGGVMWRTSCVGRLLRVYIGPAILGVLLGWAVAPLPAQAPPATAPALSETQRLKADNLKLRFALLQAQQRELQQAADALDRDRAALEAEFRQTLQPPAGSAFNWNTYSFDRAPTDGAATGAPAPTNGDRKPQR